MTKTAENIETAFYTDHGEPPSDNAGEAESRRLVRRKKLFTGFAAGLLLVGGGY